MQQRKLNHSPMVYYISKKISAASPQAQNDFYAMNIQFPKNLSVIWPLWAAS